MLKWFKQTWQKVSRWLGWRRIGIGFIFAILLFLVWKVPEWLISPSGSLSEGSKDLIDTRDNYRKTFIQVVGGIAILYGLYLTNRRTKALEDTARISEEGQITERFTRAIDQLGNEKMEIRLGGIYALEKIAFDVPEKYHWTVIEVLTAFVRERSKVDKNQNLPKENDDVWKRTSYETSDIRSADTDILAIADVVRRRKSKFDAGIIDLHNTYLRGANLMRAYLGGAYLEGADLRGAKVGGANLGAADLRGAKLDGAYLSKTYLMGAILEGAYLWRVNLGAADLWGADLRGVNLGKADLGEASLEEANLQGAHFWETDLGKAHLRGADLRGAKNLTLEQLSEVYTLYEAKLDSSLLQQVKEKYPRLLEEPKKE